MKREITTHRPHVSGCCPGHDEFPNDSYRNRRSKKARARDIKREHKAARSIARRKLQADVAAHHKNGEHQCPNAT